MSNEQRYLNNLDSSFVPPPSVGKFRLERFVASGGMGLVYAGRDEETKQPIIVKFIKPSLAGDPGMVERFRLERCSLARLEHPNVVGLLDWGTHAGVPYLVLEHVDGASLEQSLSHGLLSAAEAIQVLEGAVHGLAAAAAAGVIHRDIKPGNIFRRRDGTVKLGDFGVACPRQGYTGLTGEHSFVGTPPFAAPEQLAGEAVDWRADIYGLGATLYYALAGCTPYGSSEKIEDHILRRSEAPPSIATFRPDLPQALCRTIDRMVAPDPNERYQTYRELAQRIRRIRHRCRPSFYSIVLVGPQDTMTVVPTDGWQLLGATLFLSLLLYVAQFLSTITRLG